MYVLNHRVLSLKIRKYIGNNSADKLLVSTGRNGCHHKATVCLLYISCLSAGVLTTIEKLSLCRNSSCLFFRRGQTYCPPFGFPDFIAYGDYFPLRNFFKNFTDVFYKEIFTFFHDTVWANYVNFYTIDAAVRFGQYCA